jgi:DNA (cytosine-5)-methyltransferase 1
MPTVGSLFSGIGGLDLGLERAGFDVIWQCENDPYCRQVLATHWPDVPCHEDARTLSADTARPDLICGGFPCQPVSYAGSRLGAEDERWLWPAFARAIRLLRPRLALVENVSGLLSRGMGDVLGDLADLGYDTEWDRVAASDVGAPHRRQRVFIVAYADRRRRSEWAGDISEATRRHESAHSSAAAASYSDSAGRQALSQRNRQALAVFDSPPLGADLDRRDSARRHDWEIEPDVGRMADGVPARMDRLRTLGNAVVPQVAEAIGRRIVRRFY